MQAQRTSEVHGFLTASAFETQADLNDIIARAYRLRAETTADLLRAAWRRISGPFDGVRAHFVRLIEQRRTYVALSRCSDRVLEDIGIAREDIALIAKGIEPAAVEAPEVERRLWWHEMDESLDAALEARSERKRIQRELAAYRDAELDDIGIRRIDIPRIARGEPLPAAA